MTPGSSARNSASCESTFFFSPSLLSLFLFLPLPLVMPSSLSIHSLNSQHFSVSPSPPLWHSRLPFLTLQFLLSPIHTHRRTDKAASLMPCQRVPLLKHCQFITHRFASSLFCCQLNQNIGLRKCCFFLLLEIPLLVAVSSMSNTTLPTDFSDFPPINTHSWKQIEFPLLWLLFTAVVSSVFAVSV